MNIAAAASDPSPVPGLLIMLAGLILYFVPVIVALARRHVPHLGSVIVVNVFLGWTVVGWVVALAMACRSRPQPAGPVSITRRGHGVNT